MAAGRHVRGLRRSRLRPPSRDQMAIALPPGSTEICGSVASPPASERSSAGSPAAARRAGTRPGRSCRCLRGELQTATASPPPSTATCGSSAFSPFSERSTGCDHPSRPRAPAVRTGRCSRIRRTGTRRAIARPPGSIDDLPVLPRSFRSSRCPGPASSHRRPASRPPGSPSASRLSAPRRRPRSRRRRPPPGALSNRGRTARDRPPAPRPRRPGARRPG